MANLLVYRQPYGKHRREDFETLKFMGEVGIDIVSISSLNTADSLGNQYVDAPLIWPWFDTYNFDSLDAQIEEVFHYHPNAKILCTVDLNTPLWLTRQLGVDSFYSLSEIVHNETWRQHATNYMRAFLKHAEGKYGDRMEGYILACGATLEWLEHHAEQNGRLKDVAFKRYLREKGLGDLPVPNLDDILTTTRGGYIRDPEKEKYVIEWFRFIGQSVADAVIHFTTEARKCIRPEAKIGVFYGSVFDVYNFPQSDFERVYQVAPPDFMIGAACNSIPDIGSTSGFICASKKMQRMGIGYLHECDRITSTTDMKISDFVTIKREGIWNSWRTPVEDVAGFRREISLCLVENFSFWAFNIWGQSYKTPELRAAIREIVPVWKKYSGKSSGSTAQVLVVADMESNYHTCHLNWEYQYALGWGFRRGFMREGIPFDTALTTDLEFIDFGQYRLIVVQNPLCMTPEEEKLFRKKVCGGGRTVVWCMPPGAIHDGKFDPDHAETISGIPASTKELAVKEFADWTSVFVGDPLKFHDDAFSRQLFEMSNPHIYCENAAVRHSKEFLMVHCKEGGVRKITLPEKEGKITEVFSGRVVAENTDTFTDLFETPDTKLYYFGK